MVNTVEHHIQWNLDLTKCQGTGEICSLYRGFVKSNLDLTNFRKNNQNVRYIEVS